MTIDPPRVERAATEYKRAAEELERAQRGVREMHKRKADIEGRFAQEMQKLRVVAAVVMQSSREATLKAELKRDEYHAAQAQVALFRMTLRRARTLKDPRALRDAEDLARNLGIPPAQMDRYA